MPKGLQSTTPLIHAYILDLLVKGVRPTELVRQGAQKFNCTPRTIEKHLNRVKEGLIESGKELKDTVWLVLYERWEQQYRDTYEVKDINTRLGLQRKINLGIQDLFGYGRAKGEVAQNINFVLLIPEPIQRAMQPIVYHENSSEKGMFVPDVPDHREGV